MYMLTQKSRPPWDIVTKKKIHLSDTEMSMKRSNFFFTNKSQGKSLITSPISSSETETSTAAARNSSKLPYDIALASLSEFEMELRATISHSGCDIAPVSLSDFEIGFGFC